MVLFSPTMCWEESVVNLSPSSPIVLLFFWVLSSGPYIETLLIFSDTAYIFPGPMKPFCDQVGLYLFLISLFFLVGVKPEISTVRME